MTNIITKNVIKIKQNLAKLATQYGREAESVNLLAVSKNKPVAAIQAAYKEGQNAFGENYLQEALEKIDALRELAIEWHFIGHIQSNKTKTIAENFTWVHSVASPRIADRLNSARPPELPPVNVLIEVKLDEEPTKNGIAINEISQLASHIQTLPRLKLRGLMAIPLPKTTFVEQRYSFHRLYQAYEQLKREGFAIDTLSMGMSNDYEAAIAEGATIVRIGTAIFGARN